MVKVILKYAMLFALIFLFVSYVSATFAIGKAGYSIEKSYGPGSKISGWINISLEGEPTSSIFTGSFGNENYSLTLLKLIKKLSNFNYTCNTLNCSSNYISSNEGNSKSFSLNEGESKVIGLKINEGEKTVSSFSGFSITVTSDSTTDSEDNPLDIDILNDDKKEWTSHLSSEVFNNANYGCYSSIYVYNLANILTDDWYCERVRLTKSPSARIGAKIVTTGEADFTMSIEDQEGNYETCTASATGTGTIGCIPDFAIKEKGNYVVCIQAEETGSQINFINTNPYPCGFSGTYEGEYKADFEIFGQTQKYAPVGTFTLNNEESELSLGEFSNMESEIEDYIFTKYNNDCSNDCIIPIKITSGINQEVTLTNAQLSYYIGGVSLSQGRSFYDLSETSAKITAGLQKLYLDEANFYTPNTYSNYTFSLKLNENEILSEKISVEKGPWIKYVTPASTAVSYPTEFKVSLEDISIVTKYMWDFGDGIKQNTTTNEITHSYTAIGTYELKVTALDSNERSSSKKINILVKSASEMVPYLLNKTKEDIALVKSQVASSNFSDFEKESITFSLKLGETDKIISDLTVALSTASIESEFDSILAQIIQLKIPNSLQKTVSGQNTIFYSDIENVNIAVLKEVGGGDYSSNNEANYKEAVLSWEIENINADITFSEISAYYDGYNAPFLKTFEMNINGGENSYLIMKEMENLLFKGNITHKKTNGYVYLQLNNPTEKIIFSTTEENIDFTNLPVFISPSISELTVIDGETLTEFKEGSLLTKNPGLFILIVVFIILGALIVWVLLQIWYLKRYENYLFKNRNNLYNVITYINGVKKTGLNDKEIIIKLKKAGWNSEQIQYALKKYSGKKTWFQRTFLDKKKAMPVTINKNQQGKKD